MLIVFLKSLFTFVLVLVVVRIMGKRQLGEMQPFELVITLIIAEVACIPMNDPYIPFHNGIIPIVTLGTLHLLLSFLARKSMRMRRILSGQSVIVIDKNGINYNNLKSMNLNINDLIEAVRSDGHVDFSQIAYAIFETNGKLCIVEKSDSDKQSTEPALLPLSLFIDGVWDEANLALAGITIAQITQVLNKNKNKSLKEVLFIDVRQDGTLYIDLKHGKYYTEKISIKGGNNW